MRRLDVDHVQLAVLVLRERDRPIVDDQERDRGQLWLRAPVVRVGSHGDVIIGDHLGDVEGTVRDQRVRRRGPLVREFLDYVLPDRRARGQSCYPYERRIRSCKRDLECEIVHRLQSQRRQRGVDPRSVSLRIEEGNPLAVQDGVGEERGAGRGEPGVDQALPRVNEVLCFHRHAVRVLSVLA